MWCYRIQKQVLPIGIGADLHHLSGTSELLSQILAPFFDFPFTSFFSSQILSTHVDSLHLICTCLISSQPCQSERDFVLQSLHQVLPSTTSYYKACTQYFPVLTTSYCKACTKHVPILLLTTKLAQILLCTTKLVQSTSQYYFVLQSLHKVLPSTTSYYKACTKYFLI